MSRQLCLMSLLAASACTTRGAEDWREWYDDGELYDVAEPLRFTAENYDFPVDDEDGIGALSDKAFDFPRNFGTNLAAEAFTDAFSDCENWNTTTELPKQITGIVTLHPNFYFKTNGCTLNDEKYYVSYFIQDRTGGMFVLGDGRVAPFDAGDRVTLNVTSVRRSFGLDMIYGAEIVDFERSAEPIYFEPVDDLGDADMNLVRRVEGTVVTAPDNFGEFWLNPDGGDCTSESNRGCLVAQLGLDIQRRPLEIAVGERLALTGPVLYSYSTYSVAITRVGQIERQP